MYKFFMAVRGGLALAGSTDGWGIRDRWAARIGTDRFGGQATGPISPSGILPAHIFDPVIELSWLIWASWLTWCTIDPPNNRRALNNHNLSVLRRGPGYRRRAGDAGGQPVRRVRRKT